MNTCRVKSFSTPELFYFARRVRGRGWCDAVQFYVCSYFFFIATNFYIGLKMAPKRNEENCCRFTQDIEAKKKKKHSKMSSDKLICG